MKSLMAETDGWTRLATSCCARAPQGYPSISVPEDLGTILNGTDSNGVDGKTFTLIGNGGTYGALRVVCSLSSLA